MDNRLNIGPGPDVRELKLGSTFTNSAPSSVFHTIKYDFKPASVDVNKPAVLEVSANKQVTVTVPHLDGSGVPNTVFKGNHRDYSRKECVLILNRATGEITLEQLNSSIGVKKTRIENKVVNPPPPLPTIKVENNTARQSSKTKITTGVRKNAPISFVPKHSPLQGSPSYPHRSPQSAPAWNANNTQQTLPSIPMIGLDDGMDFGNAMPPVSLPPDRDLLPPPPVAVTGLGGPGASSDPEMMTSSESDGSDDSDSSSSDQESDSSTEDNNDSPVKESIFDPRPVLSTVGASVAAVDLSKDLCLSSNSDSDD
uniref:Ell-associated factor Eaf n=1 Tax=Anopheles albimanus TaxID=7167 RepID=A0A182FUA4_ANOAL